MPSDERPQVYLVTPPSLEPDAFGEVLARLLDACPVACLRLDLAARDPDDWSRAGDVVREAAHARDVPVVVAEHVALAQRIGADGVHLRDVRKVRRARRDLGSDAIVGAFCGASRHDGMSAGEAGADYIAFGPVGVTGLEDERAPDELFAWWSEMIELPVVAEGGLDVGLVARLAPVTDFIALGSEIWRACDPVEALRAFDAALTS